MFKLFYPAQKLQSRFKQVGVSKLVCSHLQLRHLMLSSQTEEPEVYPLSPAILEAENTLLDQSDRSTQIVLSIGPICLGLALSSVVNATSKMASDIT